MSRYINFSADNYGPFNTGDTINLTIDGYDDTYPLGAWPDGGFFGCYAWYRKPDNSTGIVWSTYSDYIYSYTYNITGDQVLDQAGYWQFGINASSAGGASWNGGAEQWVNEIRFGVTVNQSWYYLSVPNPTGFYNNGTDIRNYYTARHSDTGARADTGFRRGSTDISQYFQPGANGTNSGFRSGSSSLGSLFG